MTNKDFFSEEYEGMISMKEADDYRYLGFVISSSVKYLIKKEKRQAQIKHHEYK